MTHTPTADKPLILASQSPRRREILGYFALPFKVCPSDFDEDSLDFTGDGAAFTTQLSEGKAACLAQEYPDQLILAADTVVIAQGRLFCKPTDFDDAWSMLHDLSGSWHSVFTGVTLQLGDHVVSQAAETRVLLRELSSEQIERYLKGIHYADKAGAYQLQEAGSLIVSRIEGAYDNVVGMPMGVVGDLLTQFGIDLWHYLSPEHSPA